MYIRIYVCIYRERDRERENREICGYIYGYRYRFRHLPMSGYAVDIPYEYRMGKRDLQKRPTKETYKRDLQKMGRFGYTYSLFTCKFIHISIYVRMHM